jgi:hypothetical protein
MALATHHFGGERDILTRLFEADEGLSSLRFSVPEQLQIRKILQRLK